MERLQGLITNYRLGHEYIIQGEKGSSTRLISRTDSLFKPEDIDTSFLDSIALEEETVLLGRYSDDEYRFMGRPYNSDQEFERWENLREKFNDLVAISSIVNNKLREAELSGGGMTHSEVDIWHRLSIGAELAIISTLHEQLSIAKKNGVENSLVRYFKLFSYIHAPVVGIQIGGVSLKDFRTFNPKLHSPVPFFQFLAIALQIGYKKLHEEVLRENSQYPEGNFPNFTKSAIEVLPGKVIALAGVSGDSHNVSGNKQRLMQEINFHTKKLCEGVEDVMSRSVRILLNPKDKNFPELKEFLDVFLTSKDQTDRLSIITILGLNKFERFISYYRAVKQLSQGENGEFFSRLSSVIKECVGWLDGLINILTVEDIQGILESSMTFSQPLDLNVYSRPFGQTISEIFRKSPQKKYDVYPREIDWGDLATPELVEVEFDNNRPKKVKIILSFNNELDEEIEVEYIIDTSRNLFDWNLLEDPLTPENIEIIQFRNGLMKIASQILTNINRQNEVKIEREKQRIPIVEQVTSAKRERFDDPIYQLRKQLKLDRRNQEKNAGTQPSLSFANNLFVERTKIRNIIEIPEEELLGLFNHVSSVDRLIILSAINEYNEQGTGGKFTRKRKIGSDKKPMYTLSIGCTVPKGARVLVKEVSSKDGVRNFEIIDIRYRKDVYKKNLV